MRLSRVLYQPGVNRLVRGILRPFRGSLPPHLRLAVNGVFRVDLPGGRSIHLSANPTSHLARVLYWEGSAGYEADLLKAFLPLAERSDRFVDVGAALGYYALVAAAVNPDVRVVAFEPTPGTFGYLERNVLLNRAARITPERLALADAPGEVEFFVTTNPKFPGMAQLAGTSGLDSAGATRDGAEPERVLVQVDTLDRYVAGRMSGARIDLLKLDTEATEDRVLAGSERVLAEHRPVVLCEVLPGRIEEALEAVFDRHGYVLARATPEGLSLSERLVHGADVPNDHVMIPRERLDEVRSFVSFA